MRITKLKMVNIPRVVRQYEDRYVTEVLFQAEVEYKSKKGNDTKAGIIPDIFRKQGQEAGDAIVHEGVLRGK